MSAAAVHFSTPAGSPLSRLVRAGLLTGVVDGLWAVVLTLAYQRSLVRLWQGIAAVPFGDGMFTGGAATVVLGIVLHVCVAFAWSAVLLSNVMRLAWLRAILDSPLGALKIATVYGPFIWIAMSIAIVPLFTHKPPVINGRWFIQLAGHVVFVGLPMAWAIGRGSRESSAG